MIKKLIFLGFYVSTATGMDAPKFDIREQKIEQRKKDSIKLWKLRLIMRAYQQMSDEKFDKDVRGKIGNEKVAQHTGDDLSPREIYILCFAKSIEQLEQKLKDNQ